MKCKITFVKSEKKEAIIDIDDMENMKEIRKVLEFGMGSMDDFGETKKAWYRIEKVEAGVKVEEVKS